MSRRPESTIKILTLSLSLRPIAVINILSNIVSSTSIRDPLKVEKGEGEQRSHQICMAIHNMLKPKQPNHQTEIE